MGKRINKPTYYDEVKDAELLSWLKTKGNYSGFMRLLVTDLYNKEHGKPTLIFQQSQMQSVQQTSDYLNKNEKESANKMKQASTFQQRMKNIANQNNKNNKLLDEEQ